jgi:hypothetical protein
MLFSGVGLVMWGVVGLTALLRSGVRRAFLLVAVPMSLYLLWRAAYPTGLYPEPDYGASSLREYAADVGPYVIRGLVGSVDRFLFALPGPLVGALAVVALAIFGLRSAGESRTDAAPGYALAVGAIGFLALTGYARIGLGIDYGASSRYSYVVLALLAPLAVIALTRLGAERSFLTLAVFGVALAVAAHNVQLLREAAAREGARKVTLRQTILAGAAIARDPTQRIFPDATPEPVLSGALTIGDLRRFALSGDLPDAPPTSVESVLTAAAYVQVALEQPSANNASETACRTVAAGGVARFETSDRPVSVGLHSEGPVSFFVKLEDRATGITGAPRPLSLQGGSANLVVLRASAVALILPQDREIRVCKQAAGR